VPVWVALPFASDWRWLLEREDSPWYYCIQLYRQSQPGDWPGVFARMVANIDNYRTKISPMPVPLADRPTLS